MKKYSILLIILLTMVSSIAQTKETRQKKLLEENNTVTLGIKAGLSQFIIYGKDISELTTAGKPAILSGFYIGIEVNTKISHFFWIKHSLSAVQKGAILKKNYSSNEVMTESYESRYKNLYFDIAPISPTFHFHGFHLYTGPYVSVLVSSSIQYKNENGKLVTDKSIFGSAKQEGNYTQKIDLGIITGIEYEFENGINIGAQFLRGFVPLIEHTERNDGQWKIYNQGFSLTLGYTFGK